jgi:AraC-like DNA-binding protein
MRLLNGLYGRHIGQIAIKGTDMQRIAHVIQMLKTRFSVWKTWQKMAHMSPSSFHFHFKDLTATRPQQFQKRVRLLEARHLLLVEGHGRGKRSLSCRL